MKEVILAKSAGFCFGVKRAVESVEKAAEKAEGPVYTLGPIVHNGQVVKSLEEKGVRVIQDEDELDNIHEGTIIIRSHGITRALREKLDGLGVNVIDATCPFVRKIHKIAEKCGREGQVLIIAGDPHHPEVQGILGWTEGESIVIENLEQMEQLELPPGKKAVLVAQTTFNASKFEEIVESFEKKRYHNYVEKTVCSATDERQAEAREIARKVDAMIVIGGAHSSNSRKLYNICREDCRNTYFVETLVDLELKPFQSLSRVGITAGASTPNSIIEEVREYVRTEL